MLKKHTDLEIIKFGDQPEDIFYCLVDLRISPNGLDVEKLKLTDPRNFDHQLRESGCLLMFTGQEIESLINRGDLSRENLHQSLIKRAVAEGVLREKES